MGRGRRRRWVENGDQELPEALEAICVKGGVVVAEEGWEWKAGEKQDW